MKNSLPEYINNYLNKYGLDKWKIESIKRNDYENIIVVPAIDELENLKRLIGSLEYNDDKYFNSTLLLFVINNPESSTAKVIKQNKRSIDFLKNCKSKLNIAFVNASEKGFELPDKDGGVGLARKIGMDLSLYHFNYKSEKKKILICLDADCTVERNYLTEIVENFNKRNLSAAVVNYKHLFDYKVTTPAIICYEIFLRYYVLGLIYADSPYAIHTVGSTMCCDTESYVKVEGMNKRKAAEDFYFLEKLAKNVSVESITNTTVYPSTRGSWRVPFGTGQRVNRFLSKIQNEYLLYNPESFYILKSWLQIFNSAEFESAKKLLIEVKIIEPSLFDFLIGQNFAEQWTNILDHTKDIEQLNRQKHEWFDGFRTLKLIHHLRDKKFPMINMFEALDKLFSKFEVKIERHSKIPDLETQKKYLEKLRELT